MYFQTKEYLDKDNPRQEVLLEIPYSIQSTYHINMQYIFLQQVFICDTILSMTHISSLKEIHYDKILFTKNTMQ